MNRLLLLSEYTEARDWVATKLSFDANFDVNLFECTIRVLGAMLSSYHLTQDQLYYEKAVSIAIYYRAILLPSIIIIFSFALYTQ